MFETNLYKKDFKIFNDKELVYLDSSATTQKPDIVLGKMKEYYEKYCSSPNRGAYFLSEMSTKIYSESKEAVRNLINANKVEEIIYTKNATESLNLLAYSYGLNNLKKGDEILISILEHHSNLVPWQYVAKKTGAILKYLYINEDGQIEDREIEEKITNKTTIVSITHISNAIGTIVDVKKIIKKAHLVNAKVIVDGTQAVPHKKVDVQDLDVDFYVFSAHKMLRTYWYWRVIW